jgi:two-component system, LytTR family, sensor kinase
MLSVNIVTQLTLTIITNNYLIPGFFNKGKYIKYALFVLVGMSVVIIIRYTVNERIVFSLNRFPNLNFSIYLLFIIITTVVVFLITTGFYFFKQWFIERQKQDEIINQQLNTELKLLKAQINPHFLFNALNNVYSLTQVEPEKAGEMVLKLSEVLRYMLYDSEKDKIYLEKEISNINSLIELHQIQYDNNAKINFSINGNAHDKLIHPMLLFPFFENAFKHGNLFQPESSYIQSNLEIKENQLHFTIENTFVENTSKDKVGGLGIDNVQKRLQLFYPNNHQLEINKDEKVFKVSLKLELAQQ